MAPYDFISARSRGLCTTPPCINLASEVLWSLAPNYTEINPCTDFDKLACGNWAARHDIPAGQSGIDVLGDTGSQVGRTLKEILEGPYPTGEEAGWITVDLTEKQVKADMENFAKLQDAYRVCMNYTAMEEQGIKPLAAFVKKIVDTFPAAAESDKTHSHDHSAAMGRTLALFESLGIETTQRIATYQNFLNPNETLLIFNAPKNFFMLDSKEAMEEYLYHVATIISAVHPADITVKQATALMKSVLEWQANLLEVLSMIEQEEPETTLFSTPQWSLAEIQEIAPQLNYEFVVSQLAPKGYKAEKVQFPLVNYYKHLSQTISETSTEVMQTFFIWKAIISLLSFVESKPTNGLTNFIQRQSGGDPQNVAPRWKGCVNFLDRGVKWILEDDLASTLIGETGLTYSLGRFFLDRSYSPKAKETTKRIAETLEAAFLERIKTREWASDKVKEAAAEKVHTMINNIAVPTEPSVVDPIVLRDYYAEVNITSFHLTNALSLARVNIGKKWSLLGKNYGRERFPISTLKVNAMQVIQANAMVFAAGVQQFPIYDVDFPSYMLYGGMGSIVGHEITHGFDATGRLFDTTGNITMWWDEGTIKAFEKKTECFIKQYDNFTITAPNGTQVPVNGQLTLNENIADAGGVVSSFIAWKKWEKEHGKAKNLPGLQRFTHEQLFFLKWGQSFCENVTPERGLSLLKDTHSPSAARIKLVLANSAEFNKAFNCPKKDPVCELW